MHRPLFVQQSHRNRAMRKVVESKGGVRQQRLIALFFHRYWQGADADLGGGV